MNRTLCLLVLAGLSLAAVGCGPDAREPRLLADLPAVQALNYRIQWQTDLALTEDKPVRKATVVGDYLIVEETGNVFSCLRAADGEVVWRQRIGGDLERFHRPVADDGTIYLCSETRAFVIRADIGEVNAVYELRYNAATRPLLIQNHLVFGSPTGRVFTHSARDGLLRWEYEMGAAVVVDPIPVNGLVLVADSRGSVAMLNPDGGRIVWRAIKPPWEPISGQPVAAGGVAFVASEDGKLYAFERTSGTLFWQHITQYPLTTGPVVIGERLFQHTREGLLCLDALTGEELWRQPEAAGRPVMQMDGRLLLEDRGQLRLLAVEDGAMVGAVDLPRADDIRVEGLRSGDLYLINQDGRIMKLSPRR